jgi:hypothetical protein
MRKGDSNKLISKRLSGVICLDILTEVTLMRIYPHATYI